MRWRKERLERVRELNREMTLYAVGHLVDELKQRHADQPRVVEYLDAVQRDVIENADDFRKPDEEPSPIARLMQQEEPSLRRYQVNVLVDNGAPDVAGRVRGPPDLAEPGRPHRSRRAWERWSPTSP